ncbi:hypothetical protein PCE1_003734 [Barthelona sp. PCE]
MHLSFYVVFITLACVVTGTIVRGIEPKHEDLYSQDEFHCLDGSGSFSRSVINNGYCSCNDCSDEPGTSAGIQFFCEEYPLGGRYIHSMFVDDGICDCCDGSDEALGVCPNTCNVELRTRLSDIQERISDVRKGLIAKEDLLLRAQAIKTTKEKELLEKQTRKAIAQKAVEALNSEKEELEAERKLVTEEEEGKEEDIQRVQDKIDSVEKYVSNEESELERIKNEIAEITTFLNIDFGVENVFMPLYDTEISTTTQYKYVINPFREAFQKEKHNNHGSTSLGKFSADQSDATTWSFINGQKCWGGPDRSLRVSLICGTHTEIVMADEESMCVYVMDVKTPAVCSTEQLSELEAQLGFYREAYEKNLNYDYAEDL